MKTTAARLYRVGDPHPASVAQRSADTTQIRPGDQVRIPGLRAWLTVERVEGPEIVIVRGPNDVPLRIGRATIGEVIARGEHEN